MMEEKPKIIKRFFKIMLPGFHEKLNLPQALCKKFESVPEQAIVESCLGKWRLRVCRNQEGLIYFQNGWPDFVRDHGLNVGDLVVFEPTGNFNFKAIVFDVNACEKEYILEHPIKDAPETPIKREPVEECESISDDNKDPFFMLTMKPYHSQRKSYVSIPSRFWRSYDIRDARTILVRDSQGREWKMRVKLCAEKTGRYRCRLARGWHDFYVANELKDGDVCIFQLRNVLDCSPIRPTEVVLDAQIFPKFPKASIEMEF